jgi:hypothetical protein
MVDPSTAESAAPTIDARREIVQGLEETREMLLEAGSESARGQRALSAVEAVLCELRGEQRAYYLTEGFQNRVTAHFHEATRRALQGKTLPAPPPEQNS